MANTCNEMAAELLDLCLSGGAWTPGMVAALAADECSDALLRVVVEGLADRFEPVLCDVYACLFSEVIAQAAPGVDPGELAARYRRVRVPRPIRGEPRVIFVLSRVTLGADIAVTSVLLDAAKRRFPGSEIIFVGPRKNAELFAADPRIGHVEVAYRRGSLRERLASWERLRGVLSEPESVVLDPDSRLTQLGLLPVFPEDDYYLFESRAYGGDGDEPLPQLAARWSQEVFGIPDARPYFAAERTSAPPAPRISVSLGVGENPAKRIADPFEEELLRALGGTGMELWVDKGAGGEEAARVERAVAQAGIAAHLWEGSFAGFASLIAASSLYVGYDSAGQHAAAACGVPLLSIFAGFACPRMLARWQPAGSGRIEVVRADEPDPAAVLREALAALSRLVTPAPGCPPPAPPSGR